MFPWTHTHVHVNTCTDAAWRSAKLRHTEHVSQKQFPLQRLTGPQPVHVLQPDDVSFVEAELGPVLRDVVPHCHHVVWVLTQTWQVEPCTATGSQPERGRVSLSSIPSSHIFVWVTYCEANVIRAKTIMAGYGKMICESCNMHYAISTLYYYLYY